MSRFPTYAVPFCLVLAASACGQSGALYLPDQQAGQAEAVQGGPPQTATPPTEAPDTSAPMASEPRPGPQAEPPPQGPAAPRKEPQ